MEQVQINKVTAAPEADHLVKLLQDLKQPVESNQESLKLLQGNTNCPSSPVDGPEPADAYASNVSKLLLKKNCCKGKFNA